MQQCGIVHDINAAAVAFCGEAYAQEVLVVVKIHSCLIIYA